MTGTVNVCAKVANRIADSIKDGTRSCVHAAALRYRTVGQDINTTW